MDLMSLLVGALIQAAIGLLFYLAVRRNLEKVDRLQERIDEIEENRIQKIEVEAKEQARRVEEKFASEALKRKGLHENITDIRTHFVHVKSCEKVHQNMTAQFEKFTGAVVDLARVQEQTSLTTQRLETVSQQVIALGNDISRMEGKHERR